MKLHHPIDVINLSYNLSERSLFSRFSARIHPGARIGIIGPNGSGKSSLLKIFAGKLEPSSGKIVMPSDIRVGYLPQNLTLQEQLSVWHSATVGVESLAHDYERFQQISSQLDNHQYLEEYDILLERLTISDAFSRINIVESLLDKMDLIDYKDSLVQALSGGQRMQLGLAALLVAAPHILLLDEPTNHLDVNNRTKFIQFINEWPGTLLVASHDSALLKECVTSIWHIDKGAITVFAGTYSNYLTLIKSEKEKQQSLITHLQKERRSLRETIQKEHMRAAQSKKAHAHENDRKLKGYLKMKGNSTAGLKRGKLQEKKQAITEKLASNRIEKEITPKFDLSPESIQKKVLIHIQNGRVAYKECDESIIHTVNLVVQAQDRIAVQGENASGKSTFIKALLKNNALMLQGNWIVPEPQTIGYLDQHYSVLLPELTVFETIKNIKYQWLDQNIRTHLNTFLFSTNESVFTQVKNLSDGEKARLCLAVISAQSPTMLILDEMTNNLDLSMKSHVINVLNAYPGTLLVISHDQEFLDTIQINRFFMIINKELHEMYK